MDLKGTKRECLLCNKEGNKIVEIIDVFPEGDDFRQKLSCGHTSKYVVRNLEERTEIKEELKSIATSFSYGQVQADKTTKDSRSILCQCGHRGNQHKFLSGYTGNHNCYRCECPNYSPA
jgi:hypothetical protein